MRWLAGAALALTGCSNGILVCPGVNGGSDWICPGGTPNACALPPLLCSTSELVEACQMSDGTFKADYDSCDFAGSAGRCISGACEMCTKDLDGCTAPGWRQMDSPVALNLHALYGKAVRDVYAVGKMGTLLHYDGDAWSALPSQPDGVELVSVCPAPDGGLYAVANAPAVYAFDAQGQWSTVYTANNALVSIASAGSAVTAVGPGGEIVQFDGSAWTDRSFTAVAYAGVWMDPSGAATFVVGKGGTVVEQQGVGADFGSNRIGSAGVADLAAVWGTSPTNVYASTDRLSGVAPTVLHYDGTTWTSQDTEVPTNGRLTSVWGSGPDDLFASGTNPLERCAGSGCAWHAEVTPTAPTLMDAVGGVDATHVYAVGSGGTIWRFDGIEPSGSGSGG